MDKFNPVSGVGDIDHAKEAAVQLVIACGDDAVDLEATEHALDAIALLVEGLVMQRKISLPALDGDAAGTIFAAPEAYSVRQDLRAPALPVLFMLRLLMRRI